MMFVAEMDVPEAEMMTPVCEAMKNLFQELLQTEVVFDAGFDDELDQDDDDGSTVPS